MAKIQPYVNGIWWLDPAGGPDASLTLPQLPAGWMYEGWVVGADGPISTGRFTAAADLDSDGAGPTAGTEAIPPFPGQDFVDPAIDLTSGYAAVISIEPEPDNGPAPFAFKPLVDATIDDVGGGTLQPMENQSASLASGTVSFAQELTLGVGGLEDLGADWIYEGWLIVDGAPVSTGIFSVDADGVASTDTFLVDGYDGQRAAAFVLTIEPAQDDDPAPSDVHLLGGDLIDGTAELSIGHAAALGTDFADAAGAYIIGFGYPEAATDENDYSNGIWFSALELPTLPAGWIYEGWVVGPDGPLTTGLFQDPNGADEDGSGPTAGGPGTGPNFPGQDFLNPPVDIIGYVAAISVEPVPDNSPAPFVLKPLLDTDIEDVGDHGSQDLSNNAAAAPIGIVVLEAPSAPVEIAPEDASTDAETVEDAPAAEEATTEAPVEEPVAEEPPVIEEVVVAQGNFQTISSSYHIEGAATIVQVGDLRTVQLTDFSVTPGPELHVLLVENAAGQNTDEIGEYVDLGSLQSTDGDQEYAIASDVDLARYDGVIIYCVPFHVTFGTASFGN